MSTALGRLAASIVLDTAEFTVGAENAKRVAASTASSIDRSIKDLESSLKGTFGSIAAAFAAGFGINALKNAFEDLVTFRNKLEEVHVVTGATVESLSILGQGAKLAGTDIGTVEAALVKMTKGLSASNADTKDTARALEYLGVSGRDALGLLRDPGDVMLEVAKKLGGMADGANKTAIALALWGKAGAQMLPTMKELAENGDLVAKVTERQAQQAHEYELATTRLQLALGQSKRLILGEMVEPLTALIQVMTQAVTSTDSLGASVKALSADGSLKTWAEDGGYALAFLIDNGRLLKDTILAIASSVLVVGAEFTQFAVTVSTQFLGPIGIALRGWADQWRQAQVEEANRRWGELLESNTNKTRTLYEEQLKLNKLLATAASGGFDDQVSRAARRDQAAPFKGTDHAAAAGGSTVDPLSASNALIASLEKEQIKLNALTGESTKYAQALIDIAKIKANGKPVDEARILLLAAEIDGTVNTRLELAALYKIEDELDALEQKRIETVRNLVEKLADENEKTAFENTLIGMTTEQQKLANIAFERRIALRGIDSPLQIDAINKAYDLKTALVAQGQALTDQGKLWTDVSASAGKFFGDLVMNGSSAFDRLRTSLKSFAQELIALFAQKFLLQMVAGVTGSTALGAAASSAGQGTAAGAAGNLIGGAGTAIGGAYGAGEGFMMGWGSGVAGPAAGLAEQAGAFLATMGPIGWAAIAVAVVAAWFSQQGGGAKFGGYSGSSFDASGNLTGSIAAPGTDNGRYFTPNQMDAQLKQVTDGFGRVVANTLTRFGGTAGQAFSFLLGVDNDPRGSAASRVSAGVLDASGKPLYQNINQSMDDKAVPAAIALELSRGVLVAMQNSNLPDYLKKVFTALNASTATQAQIDAAYSMADALKTVFDVVGKNPMQDVATAVAASSNQFQTAMKNNATAIANVMKAYDGSLVSTQNLATATTAYYNAQLQLIAGIGQAKQAIDDMFGATFRNIRLAGMDTQGKYNFFQSDAASAQAQALASSDPATIQRLAGQINQDISSAFGLLTPAEQAAQSGAFLEAGRAAQAAIDARLEKIQKDAVDATQKVLNDIKALIAANVDSQAAAAKTQQDAAAMQLQAAQTPRTFNFVLPGYGSQQVTG